LNCFLAIGILGTLILIALFVGNQASSTGQDFDWRFVLFYLVIGAAQLFWMIPLIKRRSKLWFYIGIGAAAFVSLLWIVTNSPESVVGVEAPYDDLSILIEGLQVIFIMTSTMIILRGGNLWARNIKGAQPTRVLILGSGFGGTEVLKNLMEEYGDDRTVEITLVSKENFTLFTPMLADVATGLIETRHR